jgi:hypothetical protein
MRRAEERLQKHLLALQDAVNGATADLDAAKVKYDTNLDVMQVG